ncbi:MAG: DUF86 domain-containing protein [Ignavibacteriaceae bacterium]|nr:DUF86 domain-containing protein [Ignavibacteriaceae bacterium]
MVERLSRLEKNVAELVKFRKENSAEDVQSDLQKQWILRYGLFESIQIVIDLACHIVSKHNVGSPQNYADCVNVLLKEKYISKDLAGKITAMTGLRNLLVHEYGLIDINQLYSFLDSLNDFQDFAEMAEKLV